MAVNYAAESEEGEFPGLGPEVDAVGCIDAGGMSAMEGLGALEDADGEKHAVYRQVQTCSLSKFS